MSQWSFLRFCSFFSNHCPPTHQSSLLSVNWVFDLHVSEHAEIILAVMACKEKKIKHQCGDKKPSLTRLKWASVLAAIITAAPQRRRWCVNPQISIWKIYAIHSMWKNSGGGSRWFQQWAHRQVIKATRRLVEWCSNNLCALKYRAGGGRPSRN